MATSTRDETEISIVTPLGIPIVIRGGRWFFGEVDITSMIKMGDVDLMPDLDTTDWTQRIARVRPPTVILTLDVLRVDVRSVPLAEEP
jgi:hypothetical protein